MSEALHQQPDPYPNRIQDPEKAHAMALAGNAMRLNAVRHRKNYQFQNESRSHWDRQDTYYLDEARRCDLRAERFEDWAGILYEYPVSQQYKLTHLHPEREPEEGMFEYTPGDMVNLEDSLANRKRCVYDGIGDDPHKFDADRVTYAHRSTRWNLLKTLRGFQGPIEQRLESMIKLDSTTLGDLVQAYKDVWQEIYDRRQQRIEQIESMLEDVRSERASREPYAA